jgi:DNA polymerase-3 subunit delta
VTAGASVCVVGSDTTMVYDAVHNVVVSALAGLDPSYALQDFTAKDVTTGGELIVARVLEALNTPAFLADRRVVVVRDAQLLVVDEVAALIEWMQRPTPDTVLVLCVVGTKSNRLAKAAADLVEVNVGSRPADRVSFVESKFIQYGVTVDSETPRRVADLVGDDIARVDALARTLHSIYGSEQLNYRQIEPYLGDAGDVPEWDLTDAVDAGDATRAIGTARRMLDSKSRGGLQIVNILQRHYLRMVRLEGSGARGDDDAAALLGINRYPAGKALRVSQRLGPERIAAAVHMVTRADMDLKGGVSYGGRDLDTDLEVTELTVVEVLVARLARITQSARRG